MADLENKTHYRKAFKSPYLSSADIVGEMVLTIARVDLKGDETNKTQNKFNTASFVESEIRPGEKLKPMILNATNSKMMHKITESHFIEDWKNVQVVIYVDHNVKHMGDIVEGLRIKQAPQRQEITPQSSQWENAKNAYKRDGNFNAVLKRADMSQENQELAIKECKNV